ncbi:hypothetical protein AB7828_24885 [Tardiphaga sp. 215_C5_N2_1]|uniref:hypothetical protein n=1 Tax=Tardiphaga sp. 215_C5_N2_1 TaxID=3240774 RepID=UPI003F898EDA
MAGAVLSGAASTHFGGSSAFSGPAGTSNAGVSVAKRTYEPLGKSGTHSFGSACVDVETSGPFNPNVGLTYFTYGTQAVAGGAGVTALPAGKAWAGTTEAPLVHAMTAGSMFHSVVINRAVGIDVVVGCLNQPGASQALSSPGIEWTSIAEQVWGQGLTKLFLADDGGASTVEIARPSLRSKYLIFLATRRSVLGTNQFAGLAKQINILLENEDELAVLDSPQSLASFRGLLKFLASRNPKHPSLSISKAGLFVASWSPAKRAKLSLTFVDHEGGDWFGMSLDENLSDDGQFKIEEFALPGVYGSWM